MLYVAGADLMDGTPIYDIKPYLPYTDAHPDARSGFAPSAAEQLLEVRCALGLLDKIKEELRDPLFDILDHDPRPSYHHSEEWEYGMNFFGYNVRFKVLEDSIVEIIKIF